MYTPTLNLNRQSDVGVGKRCKIINISLNLQFYRSSICVLTYRVYIRQISREKIVKK